MSRTSDAAAGHLAPLSKRAHLPMAYHQRPSQQKEARNLLKKRLEFDFGFQYPNKMVKDNFLRDSARHREQRAEIKRRQESRRGAQSQLSTLSKDEEIQMPSEFALESARIKESPPKVLSELA